MTIIQNEDERRIAQEPTPQQTPAQQPAAQTQAAGGSGYRSLLGEDAPSYNPSYDAEISDIIDQINNRGDFHFDLSQSDIYNQYRERAVQNGQRAMRDAIGQGTALTGGYGNSYAQSAGQQAYGRYLESLNDVVPELEANAYARWQAEGDDLKDRYALLDAQRDQEYGRYQDEVNRYLTERQLLAQEDATAYERGRDEIADQRYADELAYSRGQQSYSQLVSLIAASGYQPTAKELAAAGMTAAQAEALRNEYLRSTGQLDSGKSTAYTVAAPKKELTAEDVMAWVNQKPKPAEPKPAEPKPAEPEPQEQTPQTRRRVGGRGVALSPIDSDRRG